MSISTKSFYGPWIRSHTRLFGAVSHVSEDGEKDIVVVGRPAGGDGIHFERMSDDETEGKMPEEVACPMDTMQWESEEPNNPESKGTQRKKGKNNTLFAFRT